MKENSQYFYSRELYPRELANIIPVIYLLASEDSNVYIVSPWINPNLEIILPFGMLEGKFPSRKTKLIDFLEYMRDLKKVKTIFYIRDDPNNETTIKELKERGFKVRVVKTLHAKAIISDRLVYEGSANITESGIYINIERCTLRKIEETPESFLKRLIGENL